MRQKHYLIGFLLISIIILIMPVGGTQEAKEGIKKVTDTLTNIKIKVDEKGM